MTTTTKKYFLICLTEVGKGFDRGWPVDPLPETRAAYARNLRPLPAGGFNADDYRIAAVSDIPGIFEIETGDPAQPVRPILFERGPYTESAFREITLQLWGHLA